MLTNSSDRNQVPEIIKSNNYSKTMEPLNYFIQTINNKTKIQKKPNSTNQRNSRYFLKKNATNSFSSSGYKTQGAIRKDEIKNIENMIIDLNNYVPNFDINIDENNNFLGIKENK